MVYELGSAMQRRAVQQTLATFDFRTSPEEAFVAAMRARQAQTLPGISETAPTTSSIVSQRFIDPVTGNDANNGFTHATAFASLSKIGASAPAGTVYCIAADSVFEVAQTFADYKATPHFIDNNIGFSNGTSAQPIVIRPYYPRGKGAKPIIRWYASMQAADWTQEAGYGGKVWSAPYTGLGGSPWRNVCFLFGTSLTPGVAPAHDANGPAALTTVYDYAADSAKVYVYVPDGSNPISYYGQIRLIGGNKSVFSAFSRTAAKIVGLQFEGVHAIKVQDYGSTLIAAADLEVQGCTFIKCIRAVQYDNRQTYATARENVLSFHENYMEDALYPQVQTFTSGTSGNTVSWEIYRNRVNRGNLNQSYGGALLYNQCRGGTRHHAWGNYGYDCRNGTGGCEIDGSFIYADIGSAKTVVYGNIVERSGVAFQANLTTDYYCIGNATIDCAMLLQSTEATMPDQPATFAVHCIQNTWLWTGRMLLTDLAAGSNIGGTGVRSWAQHPVVVINNQNGNAGGPNIARLTFANNLAVNASGAEMASRKLLEWESANTTTAVIVGNAAAGLSTTLLMYDKDSAGDKALIANYMAVIGTSMEGRDWMRDYYAGDIRPAPDGILIGRGFTLSVTYPDIKGQNFMAAPTIGSYEALA